MNISHKLQVTPHKLFIFSCALVLLCSCALTFAQRSGDYVKEGWNQLGKRNFKEVYKIVEECILEFGEEADKIAEGLSDFPPKGKENIYKVMNDVATCYFIKGEALMREGKIQEAIDTFKIIIEKYPYAQAWDPRGWFWSLKEKSEITLKKLKTGIIEEVEERKEEEVIISKISLADEGREFPVNYEKYGKFVGVGTKDYKYIIEDQEGLASACGEGVYPNTTSFRYDPGFIEVKKKLFKVEHWKVLNSRDLKLAFYKWNTCGEPWGVKQFYLGDLLERSGLIKQAIKAYYAVVVHFPTSFGWTYWHTPWYVGKAALARIKYLLKKYPQLGLELEGAYIKILNGFDHDVSNDVFIVNPGKFVKSSLIDMFRVRKRKLGKIRREIGTKVKLVQYESRDWQLLVDGKPFIIKGITYAPTRVGESPDEGTLSNWMNQDTNNNGLIDGPFEAWVDENRNNLKDEDEEAVGDFELMRQMGINCIRLYHQPYKPNKELLRKLYKDYGIMVIMGDFLGKYTIGSGAEWAEGTDYSNPQHQENMLKAVSEMVEEFKDEPYILMWLLGNENVYGVACNADKDPVSFCKFLNKTAKFIKELDPTRPVAVAWGDVLYLNIFAEYCPDVDIFGTNAYRGKYGFGFLWSEVKDLVDKPVMITEYGAPAYAQGYSQEEAEDFQAEYHQSSWLDIEENMAGKGVGNALGGIVFEWLDEWWKAYEPTYHDKKGLFSGPFLDGYMHEEWLGLCSQGDGRSSPFLRQLRKAYFTYKELWNR